MKYISLDTETTGLDPDRHDILEVAMILDDLSISGPALVGPDFSNLPNFRAVLIHEDMDYLTNPFCARLHTDLWSEIEHAAPVLLGEWDSDIKGIEIPSLAEVSSNASSAMLIKEGCMYVPGMHTHYCTPDNLAFAMNEWISQFELSRITVAGKNAASFDLPFLNSEAYRCRDLIRWSHRILDIGPAFMERGDSVIPNLEECLRRAGMEPTNLHSAMGDAFDVVRLARFKWAVYLDSEDRPA